MSAHTRHSDETKCMSFLIDDELLEKQNKIWDSKSNSIKKGFDSNHIDNEQYLKSQIKSTQNFRVKKELKKPYCICLSVAISVF